MTADGLQIVQFLFQTIWRFFSEWTIPGTGTTPAAFLIFLLFAGIGLRLIIRLFSTDSGSHINTTGGGSDR